jgi:TonB family protein
MKLAPLPHRALLALGLVMLLVASLRAQEVLFTELDGKFYAVRAANRNRALVEKDGKMVSGGGQRYVLQKTAEYRPESVDLSRIEVKTHHLESEGSELNHDFIFYAVLDTPYYLKDVFIVLELDTERMGKVLFLQEVGTLEPRNPKTISVTVALQGGMGEGKYQCHLFSGGLELMTSQMPMLYREQLLDGMVRKRISGVQDANPKLFAGPTPEYPAKLRKARTEGRAMVTLRIDEHGRVRDPELKEASVPEFGEAALAAVRLWRFLPRVKNGRPVEAVATVPVDFTPPDKKS